MGVGPGTIRGERAREAFETLSFAQYCHDDRTSQSLSCARRSARPPKPAQGNRKAAKPRAGIRRADAGSPPPPACPISFPRPRGALPGCGQARPGGTCRQPAPAATSAGHGCAVPGPVRDGVGVILRRLALAKQAQLGPPVARSCATSPPPQPNPPLTCGPGAAQGGLSGAGAGAGRMRSGSPLRIRMTTASCACALLRTRCSRSHPLSSIPFP